MKQCIRELGIIHAIAGLCAIALMACSTAPSNKAFSPAQKTERMNDAVESWVGLPQADLVEMIGAPSVTEVIDGRTVDTWFFLGRHFASHAEAEAIDAQDFDAFDCRFRVRYSQGLVESILSEGKRCVSGQ